MKTIPLRNAIACATLIGECSELGDDPDAWQDHLADRAERLIGGCTAAFKVLRLEQGAPVFDEAVISPASDAHMRAQFAQCLSDGGHRDMPALGTLLPHAFSTGAVSFRYSDLSGGLRAFHESPFYDRYLRGVPVGDALAANNVQPTGHLVSVWIMRERCDRAFSEPEESTLVFLNVLLTRLVGTRLTTHGQAARPQLSPRLRQTLDALLAGDGEKQIASLLGLRRSTVHGYIRDLYRHYGVRSRPELMARFVNRTGPLGRS